MKTLFKLLCGCLIISCLSAQASVVLGGTRIIYPSNKAEVQIALKNKDPHTRYLVQSWVSYVNNAKAPFVITLLFISCRKIVKPFYTLFLLAIKSLPSDRESLFPANVKSVSALSPELKEKNTLQFAMKTRLKLFWRPSQLKRPMRWWRMKNHVPSSGRHAYCQQPHTVLRLLWRAGRGREKRTGERDRNHAGGYFDDGCTV